MKAVTRRKLPKRVALTAVALLLSGCFITPTQRTAGYLRGAHHIRQPAGIGPNAGELKRSPCACIELKVGPDGRVG